MRFYRWPVRKLCEIIRDYCWLVRKFCEILSDYRWLVRRLCEVLCDYQWLVRKLFEFLRDYRWLVRKLCTILWNYNSRPLVASRGPSRPPVAHVTPHGPSWSLRGPKCVLEAACNSRGVRTFVLVQNIVTDVRRVLFRASRRNMRCGMWCEHAENLKGTSFDRAHVDLRCSNGCSNVNSFLIPKKCLHPNSRSPPSVGQLLVL